MIGVTPAGPAVLVVLRCDPIAGHTPKALIKVGANPTLLAALSVAEAMIAAWPPDLCATWGLERDHGGGRHLTDTPTLDLRRIAAERVWTWPIGMGLDDWMLSLVVRLHLELAAVAP